MESLRFFRSRIFIIAILLQCVAPFLLTFGNWANVIQYLSGFGMAYALWEYFHVHKPQIKNIEEQMFHLHQKQDLLHKKQDLLHKKQDDLGQNQHALYKQQGQMNEKEDIIHSKQDLIHEKQDKLNKEIIQTH